MPWFDVDASTKAFIEGAGEGVRLVLITAQEPAGAGMRAVYSYDGLPGREFTVQMRLKLPYSGTCAYLAKLMGRRAAAEIDIETR